MPTPMVELDDGDTNYVAKINANFANSFADTGALEAQQQASIGGGSATTGMMAALFGTGASIIGQDSYVTTGSGSTLTVGTGFYWAPSLQKVVRSTIAATLSFVGLSAATYYVSIDASGAASRSPSMTSSSVYSVVWTGSAFGAITLLVPIVWGAADDIAAQTSTALAASYTSLDARFEAIEVLALLASLARTWQTGRLSKSVAGSSDVVLSAIEANNAVLNFTGVLTGNINVIVPLGANPREWIATNNTSGAFTLTVKGSTGTGIAIAQAGFSNLYQDGTNVLSVSGSGAGLGSVTSVSASVPAFLSIAGSPVTTAGTLAIGLSGTALPVANGGTGGTSQSTARTALGLGTSAVLDVDTDAAMAANSDARVPSQKAVASYIASFLSNFDTKPECAYASTSALPTNTYSNGTSGVGATLTGNVNGPLLIDSVTLLTAALGSRILVAGEATDSHNGWFTLTQLGVVAVSPYILTRDVLSDQAAEIAAGYLTAVKAPSGLTPGTSNDSKLFVSACPSPFTVGTSSLTFTAIGTANTYTADESTIHLTSTTFSLKAGAVAIDTHAATAKTTPVDADEFPIVDSAASNILKKLSWLNVKATLKTYFDTLYAAVGSTFTGGTLTSALNEAPPVTIASAATVNIGAAAANTINVTGTTTITAFDTIAAGALRCVIFGGALTLTHNATSLILPGAANITTAAGDAAFFESLGSGNWRCVGYQKASGLSVVAPTTAAKRIGTPSWASSMTLDWSSFDVYRITLGGATTFTFSGAVDGQNCLLELLQDDTGSRIATLPGTVRVSTDIPLPTLTTTASKMDRLGFQFNNGLTKYDLVAVSKGY
jgi:hypothetical protein